MSLFLCLNSRFLYDCSEDTSEDGAHERGDQHGGDQDHAGVLHQSHEGEHTGQ